MVDTALIVTHGKRAEPGIRGAKKKPNVVFLSYFFVRSDCLGRHSLNNQETIKSNRNQKSIESIESNPSNRIESHLGRILDTDRRRRPSRALRVAARAGVFARSSFLRAHDSDVARTDDV